MSTHSAQGAELRLPRLGTQGRARVMWTAFDQAVCSASNVAVALLVARTASARDFGVFSLVFAGYLCVVGVSRAVSTDAFAIRFSSQRAGVDQAVKGAVGLALLVGTAGAGIMVFASLFVAGSAKNMALALALAIPGLAVQDAWRYTLLARGRPRAATANDAFWVAAQCVAFAFLAFSHGAEPWKIVAAWGMAGNAAAILGAFQSRSFPTPIRAMEWWCAHRDLGGRFVVDFMTVAGTRYAAFFTIPFLVNIEASGALRGAQTLLGPITALDLSAGIFLVIEGRRLYARAPGRELRMLIVTASSMAALALACGVGMFLLPTGLGELALGATWLGARRIVVPLSFVVAANCLATGAIAGLRIREAAASALSVRLVAAPTILGATLLGAWTAGIVGAASAQALATLSFAAIWWEVLRRQSQFDVSLVERTERIAA
jgi:hypothetical protein